MTKKLLISTLILAVGGLASLVTISPPANAAKLTIDGTDYWTIDEVTKTGQKYIEDLKMCEGRRECEEYLDTAYILAENEYSAGQAFVDNYFIITAINPAESTIRVVFHDDANRRMMRFNNDDKKDIMKNLFLYWWDGDQSRWIYAFSGPEYEENRQDIFVHIGEPEEEWLEPNKEVKLRVPDFDFSHLKNSRIFFYAKSEKTNAAGDRDITSCMKAIESLDGYECQAVFDWLGNIEYQPLKAKISTSDIGVPAEPTVEDVSSEAAKEEISTSSIGALATQTVVASIISTANNNSSNNTASGSEIVPSNTSSNDATSGDILENTNKSTPEDKSTTYISDGVEIPLAASKKEEEHQFPWWLVAFGLSGIFLILWWLIPSKKSKKTLDK